MGKMQRTKGATYEREVAATISSRLGRPTKRMLGQARDGGHDLEQVGPWLFECKRRAKIAVYEWLDQVAKACKYTANQPGGQTPVVIARADNRKSIVIMDFEDWLAMAKDVLELEHVKGEAAGL